MSDSPPRGCIFNSYCLLPLLWKHLLNH